MILLNPALVNEEESASGKCSKEECRERSDCHGLAAFMLQRSGMDNPQLKARTFNAAIRVVRLVESLPNGPRTWTIGKQLLSSGTSQAAQYRAACRAQSTRDFISKMKKMEEEADESAFWLGMLRATGLRSDLRAEAASLEAEFDELTRIALASAQTARQRLQRAHAD